MKVRIGIAEANRVVELDVDDPTAFEQGLEAAFTAGTPLLWFEDAKGRRVGIPREKVAFVEVERETERPVGFSP